MPTMTREELEIFLQRPLVVSFATVRPDGSPHVTPIWYEYDNGQFYFFVGAATVKARNLQGDQRVALCIATHDEPYEYVVAEGTCEVLREQVAPRIRSISVRYRGQERGDRFAQEIIDARDSVVLRVALRKLLAESVT